MEARKKEKKINIEFMNAQLQLKKEEDEIKYVTVYEFQLVKLFAYFVSSFI